MKMSDVIAALQANLPTVTDYFCNSYSVTNAQVNNNAITFTTNVDHDLAVGFSVSVTGVKNGIVISSVSVTDGIATLNFASDHGLNYDQYYQQKITIVGSANADGQYDVIDVPNPTRLLISFAGTDITGNAMLAVDEGFDGFYQVDAVPAQNQFTVTARSDIFLKPQLALTGGKAQTSIRISGSADMDRFNAAYTAQKNGDCWLVVTPPENRTSRDRNVTTDAITAYGQFGPGNGPLDIRVLHIETVEIYAVIPASMELAGRQAADIAENVRWQLYRSLCGADLPTGASIADKTAIMPVEDGYFSYLTDNTTYTHRYVFERTVYMTFNDTVVPKDQTAPYRGLELAISPCDDFTG